MKPTKLLGLLLALFTCLSCLPARAQAPRPVSPDSIPAPHYAPAGTMLSRNAVVFTPPAYALLRADYQWLRQDVATKAERLAKATQEQQASDSVLSLREAQLYEGRQREQELASEKLRWMNRALQQQPNQRPPLLLDRRLYQGAGLGLGLGALATAALLLFHP